MPNPNPMTEVRASLNVYTSSWSEKKGLWEFVTILAERKVFLSKKTLKYVAKMRVDEKEKTVKFSEMLIETGSGLSSGDDDGVSGFGFKTESYNSFSKDKPGDIDEQSKLFGKQYSFKFDFKQIILKVKEAVERAGYTFIYQTLPVK